MLRRKPSKIKLDLEDLKEFIEEKVGWPILVFIEEKKQGKENSKDGNQANATFEISNGLPVIDRRANVEARQAEVQRRIGFNPDPVTPEGTSQFGNIY